MEKIEKIRNFRLYLLKEVEGLTKHQLNFVPPGFNNNIIWNLGHLTAAMQNVCYSKSGLPMTVPEEYITPFLSGSIPNAELELDEINNVKQYFLESADELASDLEKKIFSNYAPAAMIEKVYGVQVLNIDDALEYLLYHEGYHASTILLLKKFT